MYYRSLGRSGIRVSPLCLGAMMFGNQTDETEARRITDRAFEQGINFIDTANVYNSGKSEEVVGCSIAANRDKWVLATKFGGGEGGWPNESGASRKAIMAAVDASLKRLGTDYIDLIYVHREDRATRIEEQVAALGELIRAGKVRYYGVSNHRAWKIAEFSHVADRLGVDRPAASQPLYNLANRQIEQEHLTACAHYGIGVVPYSPLARGVLTAKYEPGAKPGADTRAGRSDKRISETEWRAESLTLAQEIKSHAQARGLTTGQFAVAWVLANKFVTSAIAGPRILEQWEDYVPALNYRWMAEDEALVDRFVVTGHASTPGYNDPGHPYLGRVLSAT
ncbi:MAG TPA: aldo/keto reductase [Rhizomicrobium sp.]|jgi:aryl-alcohol dehydrogenase-like predicted oxidoreductase